MRGEEDRFPALPVFEENVAHHLPPDRIEPGERLVEDEKVGVMENRLREPRALEHSLGEGFESLPAVGGEIDRVDHLRDPPGELRAAHAAQGAAKGEKLVERKMRMEIGRLGKKADARHPPRIPHGMVENRHASRIGPDEAENHLDRRRLSGPVRAEEAEDLPLPRMEGDAVEHLAPPERHVAPEPLLDPVNIQHVHTYASLDAQSRTGRRTHRWRLTRRLLAKNLMVSLRFIACEEEICRFRTGTAFTAGRPGGAAQMKWAARGSRP